MKNGQGRVSAEVHLVEGIGIVDWAGRTGWRRQWFPGDKQPTRMLDFVLRRALRLEEVRSGMSTPEGTCEVQVSNDTNKQAMAPGTAHTSKS